MSDRSQQREGGESWSGGRMANGRHHEFHKPILEKVAISAAEVSAADMQWLLAAAVLNTIADDLALTCAAGWWVDYPREMAGKCMAADRLLSELESDAVANLCDVVKDGTRGRVEVGWGWMLRMARGRVTTLRMTGRRLGMVEVSEALRLPAFSAGKMHRRRKDEVEIDLTGMPPVRVNGKFNSDYGRERTRRLKAAGVCLDCRVKLPGGHGKTRCQPCTDLMNQVKQDSRRRMKEVAA